MNPFDEAFLNFEGTLKFSLLSRLGKLNDLIDQQSFQESAVVGRQCEEFIVSQKLPQPIQLLREITQTSGHIYVCKQQIQELEIKYADDLIIDGVKSYCLKTPGQELTRLFQSDILEECAKIQSTVAKQHFFTDISPILVDNCSKFLSQYQQFQQLIGIFAPYSLAWFRLQFVEALAQQQQLQKQILGFDANNLSGDFSAVFVNLQTKIRELILQQSRDLLFQQLAAIVNGHFTEAQVRLMLEQFAESVRETSVPEILTQFLGKQLLNFRRAIFDFDGQVEAVIPCLSQSLNQIYKIQELAALLEVNLDVNFAGLLSSVGAIAFKRPHSEATILKIILALPENPLWDGERRKVAEKLRETLKIVWQARLAPPIQRMADAFKFTADLELIKSEFAKLTRELHFAPDLAVRIITSALDGISLAVQKHKPEQRHLYIKELKLLIQWLKKNFAVSETISVDYLCMEFARSNVGCFRTTLLSTGQFSLLLEVAIIGLLYSLGELKADQSALIRMLQEE